MVVTFAVSTLWTKFRVITLDLSKAVSITPCFIYIIFKFDTEQEWPVRLGSRGIFSPGTQISGILGTGTNIAGTVKPKLWDSLKRNSEMPGLSHGTWVPSSPKDFGPSDLCPTGRLWDRRDSSPRDKNPWDWECRPIRYGPYPYLILRSKSFWMKFSIIIFTEFLESRMFFLVFIIIYRWKSCFKMCELQLYYWNIQYVYNNLF